MLLRNLQGPIQNLLLLSFALLVSALFSPPLAAQDTCKPLFDAAVAVVDTHAAGIDEQQKLRTKIENAWRKFQFEQPTKNALKQLDVALRMLNSPATRSLPSAEREVLDNVIRAFRSCLGGATAPETATLIVRTYQLDETKPDFYGEPQVGAYVSVDGHPVGKTGVDGSLSVEVPAGLLTVKAVVPSISVGVATIDLPRGTTNEMRILMDDGKEVVEQTQLNLLEAPESILAKDFTSFTLRFDSDAPVNIVGLDLVEMLDADGNIDSVLDGYFSVAADGSIVATNVTGLRSMIAWQTQEIALRVQGMDEQGFTHVNIIRFRIGHYQLTGYLVPPPSNPSLTVADIPVKIEFLGSGITLWRTSDAQGRFELKAAPLGNTAFDSETLQGSMYYYGQGTIFLNSSRTISVVMRSLTDVTNGVQPITTGAPTGLSAMKLGMLSESAVATATVCDTSEDMERQLENQATRKLQPLSGEESEAGIMGLMSLNAVTNTASAYAVAGANEVPVSQTATMTLPKGTQKLVLTLKHPLI